MDNAYRASSAHRWKNPPTRGASARSSDRTSSLKSNAAAFLDTSIEVDHGKLVYPVCKRARSDFGWRCSLRWDHTRLDAMRYVTMVRPRDETVIDFTGNRDDRFLQLLFWLASIG